jgi:hypothetical protein
VSKLLREASTGKPVVKTVCRDFISDEIADPFSGPSWSSDALCAASPVAIIAQSQAFDIAQGLFRGHMRKGYSHHRSLSAI